MTILKFFSVLAAGCLFVSSGKAGDTNLECLKVTPLATPMRSGWDTLLAVESVKVEDTSLTLGLRYLDATEGIEKSVVDVFNIQSQSGMYVSYDPNVASSVEFNSVGLGIRNINAPLSAGPTVEGNHPATATLVLVTEHYPTVGAPKQIDVLKLDLNCVYKVRYH